MLVCKSSFFDSKILCKGFMLRVRHATTNEPYLSATYFLEKGHHILYRTLSQKSVSQSWLILGIAYAA